MKKKDIELIHGVKAFIDRNASRSSSVKEICVKFGVNKNKLQGGFKLLFGRTIHAYVMEQRMKQAATMLKNTNNPIKSIASETGFTSSNFHIKFKKIFGHSPKQFRRKEDVC